MTRSSPTGELTVELTNQPFGDDPDGASDFYAAVGRAIMLWGRFESMLEMTLLILMNLPECKSIRPFGNNVVPTSFSRRRDLWKKLFKELPALEEFRSYALKLMSEADDTAKDRAAVIHSSWNGFIQSNPLTMKAIHRQYRSGKILHRIYEFELKEIEEIVLTINLLNTRILPILFKATQLSQVQNKAEADLPPGAGTS